MNARSQVFELAMEGHMVDEALASIFHTILFHRSLGKFVYNGETTYSVGSVGFTDVDCNFFDMTYVCCTCEALDKMLKDEIHAFSEQLRSNDSLGAGQITLEFFEKKKRWVRTPESVPWEIWTVHMELIHVNDPDERCFERERVGELLTDKILYISNLMNKQDYLPKMPSQSELDFVFDTSYESVQPYLFKCKYSTAGPSESSVGHSMKKFIKETLSL
ncbi:autophagy-related protein 101 [Contarinia nasturtii]|uniref:autophagy-related protein 101 n=1 Tax=Contarinia nasturtii TaxID=265458 RepID=UPI0012D4719F|nr:autophagy-related protein 101 [Contarinia nasturtii]